MNLTEKRDRVITGDKGRGKIISEVGEVIGLISDVPTTGSSHTKITL